MASSAIITSGSKLDKVKTRLSRTTVYSGIHGNADHCRESNRKVTSLNTPTLIGTIADRRSEVEGSTSERVSDDFNLESHVI